MRKSKRKIAGVVSIEFALGFTAFWALLMGWVESSYVSYISALCDYAVSEASRNAKKENVDYMDSFKSSITNSTDSIWGGVVDVDKFKLRITYEDTLADLAAVASTCSDPTDTSSATEAECGTEVEQSLAIYYITYDYDGLFTFLYDDDMMFSREVIVIQEYERDAFYTDF